MCDTSILRSFTKSEKVKICFMIVTLLICVYTCEHLVCELVRKCDVRVISMRFANCLLGTFSRWFFQRRQRIFVAQWVLCSSEFLFFFMFAGIFSYLANSFLTNANSSPLVRHFPLVRGKFVEK